MPLIPPHLRLRVYAGAALALAAIAGLTIWRAADRRLKFEAVADASSEAPSAAPLSSPIVLGAATDPAAETSAFDKSLAAIAAAGERFDGPGFADAAAPLAAKAAAAGVIPVERRWQLYFSDGLTQSEYARQLDFFKIELGVVGGENIDYLSQLSRAVPDKRTAPGAQESRLYLAWHRGPQAEADRQFAALANVSTADKVLVHFLPAKVEERLADLERRHAGRAPGAILRTRFGVRKKGAGYDFYVADQTPLH